MSRVIIEQEPGRILNIDDERLPLYYDPKRNQCYWIEWEDTGNNELPHRHYLKVKLELS